MPAMPSSYMRSTISFTSWRHSKYAISGLVAGVDQRLEPGLHERVRPPQSTTCSPNRSVSVSSANVVSMTPARVPPMASAYDRARSLRLAGGVLRHGDQHGTPPPSA